MPQVLLSKRAQADLDDLQPDISDRIRNKLREVQTSDTPRRYIKTLTGHDEDRIRIGDYRAFVTYFPDRDEIEVYHIDPRDTAYDR